jgi:3-phenylpropionate/trans-cinnamate dioxygenase ferredoxin reductase subunit
LDSQHCIVVGASHAAAQLAAQLRQGGWTGRISIVGEEAVPPYHRPPLSKDYLTGVKQSQQLLIRPLGFYEKNDIELHLGRRVQRLDREQRRVHFADDSQVAYDRLALVTGARPRRLALPGAELDGVCYLRDLADTERIRTLAGSATRAAVVGGGYIGLETAASLRKLGLEVTVLEALPRVLQRVTAEPVSDFFARVHGEEGVEIRTDVRLAGFDGDRRVNALHLESGESIAAELVIVGVGVQPATELAEDAGLEVNDGIVVDEFARTSDHDIVAAGDCTRHYNPIYDRWLRLESVQNATDQARTAAGTLNGDLKPYHSLPWFWSDQYDVKLQIAGLSTGFDRVVLRGDSRSGRSFAAFYFAGERLLAVDAVNRPRDYMAARKALSAGQTADPDRVADELAELERAFRPL